MAIARGKGLSRGISIARTDSGDFAVRHTDGRSIIIGKRHAIYLADMVAHFDFHHGAVRPNERNEVHYEKPALANAGGGRTARFTSPPTRSRQPRWIFIPN